MTSLLKYNRDFHVYDGNNTFLYRSRFHTNVYRAGDVDVKETNGTEVFIIVLLLIVYIYILKRSVEM